MGRVESQNTPKTSGQSRNKSETSTQCSADEKLVAEPDKIENNKWRLEELVRFEKLIMKSHEKIENLTQITEELSIFFFVGSYYTYKIFKKNQIQMSLENEAYYNSTTPSTW